MESSRASEASLLPNEQVRDFVIAAHGDLQKVKDMLAADPALLHITYAWAEYDTETAIQAAAHVGDAAIARYLLEQGAALEICTAAMLGRRAEVERLLDEDPGRVAATGAHGISLLAHAALSGDATLVENLYERGARAGVSLALHNAVAGGHLEVARWLLENTFPELGWQNYAGKTALEVAEEGGNEALAALLREHGASA
jgi:ankyrin repeat protein